MKIKKIPSATRELITAISSRLDGEKLDPAERDNLTRFRDGLQSALETYERANLETEQK